MIALNNDKVYFTENCSMLSLNPPLISGMNTWWFYLLGTIVRMNFKCESLSTLNMELGEFGPEHGFTIR